jgi:hypothetical protein
VILFALTSIWFFPVFEAAADFECSAKTDSAHD